MVRPKYRYICIEITPVRKREETEPFIVKHNDIYKALILMIKKMHGDFGLASLKTGFSCKYCNDVTKVAVIKSRHGPHRFVTTSIPLITVIGKVNVRLQTIRCTATLHQAYRFLKRYQQLELERLQQYSKVEGIMSLEERCMNLKTIEDLMMTERQNVT